MTKINQIILDCLQTCYRIEVSGIHLLPLGADPNSSVYKVLGSDQKNYFVKVKGRHPDDAWLAILELLQSAGIREIIFPIKAIGGELTQKWTDFTLIVYPFIEGQDGFRRSLNHRQWIQFGEILRKIHEIKVPTSIQRRIRREHFSSKWQDAVRSLYIQLDKISINDQTGRQLLKLLRERKTTIEELVDCAERLSHKCRNKSLQFVLCHSDIHGGNILLSDDGAFHIVDWDDPIMAPKERDLMFIGGGVGNIWNDPLEEGLFYQGYGNASVDEIILAYYRFERVVEDIAVYAHELLMNAERSHDREQMYNEFVNLFEARGVIDLAFKTYKNLTVS